MRLIAIAVNRENRLTPQASLEFNQRGRKLKEGFPYAPLTSVGAGVLISPHEISIFQKIIPHSEQKKFVRDGGIGETVLARLALEADRWHDALDYTPQEVVYLEAVRIFVEVSAKHNLHVVFRSVTS